MRRLPLTLLLAALGGCAGTGAGHGLAADRNGYLANREGVPAICRPVSAEGAPQPSVCPAAFPAAAAVGAGLHERGAALHQMRRQLHDSQQRARQLEDRLAETSALLFTPGLAPTERATVVAELEQLAEEKREVAHSIDQIEHHHAAAEFGYASDGRHVSGRPGG
jgi:hypothetical protein